MWHLSCNLSIVRHSKQGWNNSSWFFIHRCFSQMLSSPSFCYPFSPLPSQFFPFLPGHPYSWAAPICSSNLKWETTRTVRIAISASQSVLPWYNVRQPTLSTNKVHVILCKASWSSPWCKRQDHFNISLWCFPTGNGESSTTGSARLMQAQRGGCPMPPLKAPLKSITALIYIFPKKCLQQYNIFQLYCLYNPTGIIFLKTVAGFSFIFLVLLTGFI